MQMIQKLLSFEWHQPRIAPRGFHPFLHEELLNFKHRQPWEEKNYNFVFLANLIIRALISQARTILLQKQHHIWKFRNHWFG